MTGFAADGHPRHPQPRSSIASPLRERQRVSGGAAEVSGPGGGPPLPRRFNLAAALLHAGSTPATVAASPSNARTATWTFDEVAARTAQVAQRPDRARRAGAKTACSSPCPTRPSSSRRSSARSLAGAVAVPCNTFLGPADYAYFLDESRAPVLVTTAAMRTALTAGDRRGGRGCAAVLVTDADADDGLTARGRSWVRRRADGARRGRHPSRRAGLLAVDLGQHGRAEGRGAPAPGLAVVLRRLRRRRARPVRGRSHLLGGQALPRLRARQQPGVPVLGRRAGGAAGRNARRRRRCSTLLRRAPAHGVLRRAHALRRAAAAGRRRTDSRAAARCASRCRPASRLPRRSRIGAGANASASSCSTPPDRPKCCTATCRRGPAG